MLSLDMASIASTKTALKTQRSAKRGTTLLSRIMALRDSMIRTAESTQAKLCRDETASLVEKGR